MIECNITHLCQTDISKIVILNTEQTKKRNDSITVVPSIVEDVNCMRACSYPQCLEKA